MNIDPKYLEINYDEVLRYLGYRGQKISEELENTIKECIQQTKNKINPRYILRVYPIERYIKKDSRGNKIYSVKLAGTNVDVDSEDIYNMLNGCSECVIMATTLGLDIEREIKRCSYSDLSNGIIIDSCATTAIEEVCDLVENRLREELYAKEKHITNRYSPGYGDLPIDLNRKLIDILGTQNSIGLTITESNIMLPRKSVVAIIGISESKLSSCKKSCLDCNNYNNCKYRKEVDGYGY